MLKHSTKKYIILTGSDSDVKGASVDIHSVGGKFDAQRIGASGSDAVGDVVGDQVVARIEDGLHGRLPPRIGECCAQAIGRRQRRHNAVVESVPHVNTELEGRPGIAAGRGIADSVGGERVGNAWRDLGGEWRSLEGLIAEQDVQRVCSALGERIVDEVGAVSSVCGGEAQVVAELGGESIAGVVCGNGVSIGILGLNVQGQSLASDTAVGSARDIAALRINSSWGNPVVVVVKIVRMN